MVWVYLPSGHHQSHHPCPNSRWPSLTPYTHTQISSVGLPTFRTSPKPPLPSVQTIWNSWVSRDLPFLSTEVLYSIQSFSSSLPTSLFWSPGHRCQEKHDKDSGSISAFKTFHTAISLSEELLSFWGVDWLVTWPCNHGKMSHNLAKYTGSCTTGMMIYYFKRDTCRGAAWEG